MMLWCAEQRSEVHVCQADWSCVSVCEFSARTCKGSDHLCNVNAEALTKSRSFNCTFFSFFMSCTLEVRTTIVFALLLGYKAARCSTAAWRQAHVPLIFEACQHPRELLWLLLYYSLLITCPRVRGIFLPHPFYSFLCFKLLAFVFMFFSNLAVCQSNKTHIFVTFLDSINQVLYV